MRIATDIVKIFRVMNIGITPPLDHAGDLYAAPGSSIALSAVVVDPENATPYTYKWEQAPVTVPGSSFSAPDQQTTSFGPLTSGVVYLISLTVTSARLQTKNLRFRLLVE